MIFIRVKRYSFDCTVFCFPVYSKSPTAVKAGIPAHAMLDNSVYYGGVKMKIRQYDNVLLKDGRTAAIVEVFEGKDFIADVRINENGWETITITIDDIGKVLVSNAH